MIEEYEIHPLTQELLYDEVGDEALHKENIKELVKIIRKMLPSDVQDMVLYLEQNKTLTMNIEKVLEHADSLNIQNDDTFIIKVSLLRAYTDLYLYDDANRLIKDIENHYIDDTHYQSNDLLTKYSALFYLVRGKVFQYRYGDNDNALDRFIKADKLSEKSGDAKLRYFVLIHLSQVYLFSGDVKNSKYYLEQLEKEEREFLESFNDKHTYYWMNGKHLFEEGKEVEALREVKKAEEIEYKLHGKGTTRIMPVLLFKADILLALGEYKQVEEVFNLLSKICIKNVGNYKYFMSRTLRIGAQLDLAKRQFTKAYKEIDQAIELTKDTGYGLDNYVADIYIVKGDILFADRKYKEAFEWYQDAEDIHLKRYNDKIEVRKFSELYERIVDTALKLDWRGDAYIYYQKHYNHFGDGNPRTGVLLSKIFQYDVKRNREQDLK
jgi:tetratricopeptide (TPR) repeat protein